MVQTGPSFGLGTRTSVAEGTLRRLFALTSLILFLVIAILPIKNALLPYRFIQREYAKHGASLTKNQEVAQGYLGRSIAIQQIWIPEFQNRIDRCTTCHLGVIDENMTVAPLVFRLHSKSFHTPKDFMRFGCTSCHGGEGLATLQAEAHGTVPEAEHSMTPFPFIEAGCGHCHLGEQVNGAPVLSRGRKLMVKAGCFACHLVNGQEGYRSEAPPLESISLKTGGMALKHWLKDPKSMDANASMPRFDLQGSDIDALTHYLLNATPVRNLYERVRIASLDRVGDSIRGRKIFAEARCISCHTVDGKGNGSAPELSKVASRVSRSWLFAFIKDPQAFSPCTRMPRYGFSERYARDVASYVEAEFKDFDAPNQLLDSISVNQFLVDKGRHLFHTLGCNGCHVTVGKDPERIGPELNGIGDKRIALLDFGKRLLVPRTLSGWLHTKLVEPRSFGPGLKMPSYGFNPEELQASITALLSMGSKVPEKLRQMPVYRPSLIPGGRVGALFERYRCLSCHQIGGRGGDISTAPLTVEGSKVTKKWLVEFLMKPYAVRPILKDRMPALGMTNDEAHLITEAIETFYLDSSIPDDSTAGAPISERGHEEGRRLFEDLGCRACHILGTKGGYFGPQLNQSGMRLKPGWIYAWLKEPQKWRGDVRCPNYGLSDSDAGRLASFLHTFGENPFSSKPANGVSQ